MAQTGPLLSNPTLPVFHHYHGPPKPKALKKRSSVVTSQCSEFRLPPAQVDPKPADSQDCSKSGPNSNIQSTEQRDNPEAHNPNKSSNDIVVISADEDSEEDELLRQPMEDATKTAHGTIRDAHTATTSELAPQASLDTLITDQAHTRQSFDSGDGFIHIDSLFDEICGNDDNTLVTNDPAVLPAPDANTTGQAILRPTFDLSEPKACEVAADDTTAVSDNTFATTSTDQIATEGIPNLPEEDEAHEDAINNVVVSATASSSDESVIMGTPPSGIPTQAADIAGSRSPVNISKYSAKSAKESGGNKRFSCGNDGADVRASDHRHDTEDGQHSVSAHSPSTSTVDTAENVHVQSENSSTNYGNGDVDERAIHGTHLADSRASAHRLQRRAKMHRKDVLSRVGKAHHIRRQKPKERRRRDKSTLAASVPFTSPNSSTPSGTRRAGIQNTGNNHLSLDFTPKVTDFHIRPLSLGLSFFAATIQVDEDTQELSHKILEPLVQDTFGSTIKTENTSLAQQTSSSWLFTGFFRNNGYSARRLIAQQETVSTQSSPASDLQKRVQALLGKNRGKEAAPIADTTDSESDQGSDNGNGGAGDTDDDGARNRKRRRWTPLEEQRVLAWKKEGKSYGWMSERLIDRTAAAVCTRWHMLQSREPDMLDCDDDADPQYENEDQSSVSSRESIERTPAAQSQTNIPISKTTDTKGRGIDLSQSSASSMSTSRSRLSGDQPSDQPVEQDLHSQHPHSSTESRAPSPEDPTPTASPAEADDRRLEPELETLPPQPSLASRKRSSPSDDTRPLGDSRLSKRPRRKITRTRKAREADEVSAEPDKNVPCHANPRQHLNWRVKDLESVHLAKDGSIQCTVIWEPTVVAKAELVGAALHNRCEELFKEVYGQDEWKKWLTTHGASKQRRR